jgi:hypothetical protein
MDPVEYLVLNARSFATSSGRRQRRQGNATADDRRGVTIVAESSAFV